MAIDPTCWKCGSGLNAVPLPFGRRAECPSCRAELHVCRQCRHYDTSKAKQCRELAADEVRDKGRANFCEWFQPTAASPTGASAKTANNRSALDDLFS